MHRNAVFFPCLVALEAQKVSSLKRRVRRAQLEKLRQKWALVVAQCRFAKSVSNEPLLDRAALGSWDVEKWALVVARCRLVSQYRKIPTCPGHFSTSELHLSWQAQGILHVAKRIKNPVFFFNTFQKRWQAWGIWRKAAFFVAGAAYGELWHAHA